LNESKPIAIYLNLVSDKCRRYLVKTCKDKLIKEPSENIVELSKLLSVLSNPIRLSILWLLLQMEMPVCLITAILGKGQTLISHHLRRLKDIKLVNEEVRGKFRYYSINPAKRELIESVFNLIELI